MLENKSMFNDGMCPFLAIPPTCTSVQWMGKSHRKLQFSCMNYSASICICQLRFSLWFVWGNNICKHQPGRDGDNTQHSKCVIYSSLCFYNLHMAWICGCYYWEVSSSTQRPSLLCLFCSQRVSPLSHSHSSISISKLLPFIPLSPGHLLPWPTGHWARTQAVIAQTHTVKNQSILHLSQRLSWSTMEGDKICPSTHLFGNYFLKVAPCLSGVCRWGL